MEKEMTKKQIKIKKLQKLMIVFAVLIILMVVVIGLLRIIDNQREKLLIDGAEIPIESISYNIGKEKYINLKEFSNKVVNFTYNNGEYNLEGKTNEGPGYFYLRSPYEIVQLKKDSKTFTKYIELENCYFRYDKKGTRILTEEEKREADKLQLEDIDKKKKSIEEFKLEFPIEEKNGEYYVNIKDLKYIYDLKVVQSGNTISLYSVEYLEKAYASVLNKNELVLHPNYQNRRAIIDDYIVAAKKAMPTEYGVSLYQNKNIVNKIGLQYQSLRFAQDKQNIFIMKNKKLGLLRLKDGATLIEPDKYELIEAYINELDLYIVQDVVGKYGVIDGDSNVIVHPMYDKIGYDTSKFPTEKAGKIFFGRLIPVLGSTPTGEKKWQIYDLKTKGRVGDKTIYFEDLGYKDYELVEVSNNNEVLFTSKQIEDLKQRGYTNIEERRLNVKNNNDLRILHELGYVINKSEIGNIENTLTVPDETGFGGIVVKVRQQGTSQYRYGIISSTPSQRENPYILSPTYVRIYKEVQNGINKYFAVTPRGKKDELYTKPTNNQNRQMQNNQN